MRLVYEGPHDAVEIPDLDNVIVSRGEAIDVPDEIAGRAPKGDDPGEGWLSQIEDGKPIWRRARAEKPTPPTGDDTKGADE